MMNKEVYLKNVAESLALLSREVSILNAVNLYDIHNRRIVHTAV